ncbi:hypothetical protein CGCF415_v000645 [Colletotrichum fructicola]|uniref:Uncharacterized protein n=1 Tax=Colletotrichum fructicola (strain Nara gc5) TaxID=1213859 RepID=L2FF00_COLFN|nr:uncharacterized protein CGMCC3_g3570 [Colletotrichum fructicola]KAE9580502.1 hypothetical protein CGMCC3_g3570 [Colletotrichum fructicola]KAF4894556.1 hypothetical protein CGCFRS4_v006472 [Colletotrichum fructicola]KAF4916586.1 hypothetical protein CGCF415_v000645 [Colletotrichum fructicola]KAF4940391.1 hypothetical protein CGCF245_v002807 [Colletotrichum fructicola]
MSQRISEDAWDPPVNAQSHGLVFLGDSVGVKGVGGATTLGPMLEFSGKYYWLVSAHLFEDVFSGDKVPQDVILVHPAELDCRPGQTPTEIGVLKYWSGKPYMTSRESSYMKRIRWPWHEGYTPRVITDWALFEVLDGMAVARNELRYVPPEREINRNSGTVTSFLKDMPQLRVVQTTGRSSGLRYAMVCEGPASVRHSSTDIRTEELFVESMGGLPGLISEAWNTEGIGMPGDTGASIIDEASQQLIGTVWGCNVHNGDERIPRVAYFTSIYDILDDVYEKHPELGLANLPGGDVYDPRALVLTKMFDEDPANVEEEPPSGPLFATTENSITEPQACPVPQISANPEVAGNGAGNVVEIDSEVESVFSDTESLSSQSSAQAIEAQALREAITSLFLVKSGVIDIFETGLRLHGIGGETMTARLRRSLRMMGTALGLDSNTLEQKACSRRIKRDAEYIANAVRQRCDPEFARRQLNIDKTPISKEEEAKFIMEMWQRGRAPNAPIGQPRKSVEYDSDSEDDDQFDPAFEEELKRELDRKYSQTREEVESFILNSEHLVTLKNSLQSLFVEDANIPGLQDKPTNGLHSDPEEQLAEESEDLQSQLLGGAIEAPYERRSLPDVVESWFPQWFDFFWEPAPQPGSTRIRWTCVRFVTNTAEMKMLT